ncbi:MAG: hypothetical protein ABEL76_13185 [Bradymonadaceae bacterium]
MSGTTERGRYYLEVTPDPNPVPFQEFVTIRVRVHAADDRDSPLEGAELNQFRARMPAHDHGLKTDPTVERIGPGEFVLKGVRFHMRGRGEDGHWTLEFVVDGPRGLDTATFDLQCCRLTDD